MYSGAAAVAAGLLLAMSQLTNADCECGYSLNKTSDADYAVYTDLLENDFLHTSTDNLWDAGWRPQAYNVSAGFKAGQSRGDWGKRFAVSNVETNPLKDSESWSGESENGGDAGLQLWVRGDHSDGFVSGAELATERNDCRYGSFRVGMKLAAQNGTCGAFFYFMNDTQEIDMEFLSKQFQDNSGAVNLVLQSPESLANGYDASNTTLFKVQELPFAPDGKFHEYRFDWTPDRVSFYVDGKWLHDMTEEIPVEAGHLFFNHWSNGDGNWTAGPPDQDTVMTVSYVKAYFNSTDPDRTKSYQDRCETYDPSKVCAIPAQEKAPDGNDAETYFFTTDDTADKAPGQIVYSGASSFFSSSTSTFAYLPLLVTLLWTISL